MRESGRWWVGPLTLLSGADEANIKHTNATGSTPYALFVYISAAAHAQSLHSSRATRLSDVKKVNFVRQQSSTPNTFPTTPCYEKRPMSFFSAGSRPLRSLTIVFLAWKLCLLAVALGTVLGIDYDTSTSLFFQRLYGKNAAVAVLAERLTRWDAIYYMRSARQGYYVYEQDWAFGAGLPVVIRSILECLSRVGLEASPATEPVLAIMIAHGSHFVAVLTLYKLTTVIFKDQKMAFLAATLHVISPAGLFLSAPYSESPCACLCFIGVLLFATGLKYPRGGFKRNILVIAAGLFCGVATAFRSNGLSYGVLFAMDLADCLLDFMKEPRVHVVFRAASTVIGGLSVAAGGVVPQAIAWKRYCWEVDGAELRPWCSRSIPSIYTFVQEHYW